MQNRPDLADETGVNVTVALTEGNGRVCVSGKKLPVMLMLTVRQARNLARALAAAADQAEAATNGA